MKKELSVMHTAGGLEEAVGAYRRKNLKKYALVLVVVAVVSAGAGAMTLATRSALTELPRPGAGDSGESVAVRVEAEYGGKAVRRDTRLTIRAAQRTDEERQQMLAELAERLPDRIVPASDGVRLVLRNLDLPEKDADTGIEMTWQSDLPEVLSEDGRVDVTKIDGEQVPVDLIALLRLENCSREVTISVVVVKDPSLYLSSIHREVEDLVDQISESTEGDKVSLPGVTSSGVKLRWETGRASAAPMIILLGLAVLLVLYNSRYERARKAAREYRAAVIAEFPNVIDKLVLLLNSGLTVFSALVRLSEEYAREDREDDPMGRELAAIGRRVKSTNASILEEWKRFASRVESADILRFCTILEDNMSKGSELSRKLENESETFMDMRRKNIQQQIRMIDSKMVIPMMAMLLSLVLVTIAPVITGF